MKLIIRDVQKEDSQGIIDVLNPIIEAGIYTILDTTFSLEEEEKLSKTSLKEGSLMLL